MEIFCDGKVVELDDYRSLRIAGRNEAPWTAASPLKGQYQELEVVGRVDFPAKRILAYLTR